MQWWKRMPGDREQWTLDPLNSVGPLRFGMSPDQVAAALGTGPGASQKAWEHYHPEGIVAFYERSSMVAVLVEAMNGPLLRLRDVELIARVPSEARADLHELADHELADVAIRPNWSGDPEIPAWGVSMGTAQEWGHSPGPDGFIQRRDTVITNALLVSADLADDPFHADPVVKWRDIDELEPNPGSWPVKPDRDRPRWGWTPLEHVGPLRFGMTPAQVSAALDGEDAAARVGRQPWELFGDPGQWSVWEERYDRAGVTAHYWPTSGLPALGAVTVRGRIGPQVSYAGRDLIGKTVSALDAFLAGRAEEDLMIGCNGDSGLGRPNLFVRATRAGDAVISEARFGAEDWEDHG